MTTLNLTATGLPPLQPITLEKLTEKVEDLAQLLEAKPHARAIFDQYFACNKDEDTRRSAKMEALILANQQALFSDDESAVKITNQSTNTELAEVLFRDFAEQKKSALQQLAYAHSLILAENSPTDKTQALKLEIERCAYRTAMSMTRPTVRQLACPTGRCEIGRALAETVEAI